MTDRGTWLVFFALIGIVLLSGCLDTESEVIELNEPVTQAETQAPAPIPPTPGRTSQGPAPVRTSPEASKVQATPSLTHTIASPSPKFSWGDLIEAPNGTRYILLEGNPGISGIYTVYRIKKCPCVQLLYLNVKDTDGQFRKVGTQNPMTICNESVLKVLKDPTDLCNIVEPASLRGSGKTSRSISVPYDGRFTMAGSHSGEGEFLVEIVDADKDPVASLFGAAGPYYGTETVNLEAGRYTLRIQASGSWTIEITTM